MRELMALSRWTLSGATFYPRFHELRVERLRYPELAHRILEATGAGVDIAQRCVWRCHVRVEPEGLVQSRLGFPLGVGVIDRIPVLLLGLSPGASAQNNLGVILMMQGDPTQAASYFQAAIRFDPLRSAEPYFNLAKAAEQLLGQAEKARALFQQVLRLQPGIVQREHLLPRRLRRYEPGNVTTELLLMWPYGYPIPGSREGY